jgi:hypothetical protein
MVRQIEIFCSHFSWNDSFQFYLSVGKSHGTLFSFLRGHSRFCFTRAAHRQSDELYMLVTAKARQPAANSIKRMSHICWWTIGLARRIPTLKFLRYSTNFRCVIIRGQLLHSGLHHGAEFGLLNKQPCQFFLSGQVTASPSAILQ